MRKVIALIISIVMIAGLAINCLAAQSLLTITIAGTSYKMDAFGSWSPCPPSIPGMNITCTAGKFIINISSNVTIDKLKVEALNLEINIIERGKTLTVSTADSHGIDCNKNITIKGPGKLNVTASMHGIYASNGGNISINNGAILDVTSSGSINCGLFASNDLDIETSCRISAKAYRAYNASNGIIRINGVPLSNTDINNYFTSTDNINKNEKSDKVYCIYGSGKILFNAQTEPENAEVEEDNSDPEVELDLGNGPVTLKTSNNSVVFNDTKVFEVSIGDGDVFIPIDLSSAPKKIDGLFFNNEVYKYIDDSSKDIKLINRFARAEVYTNKEIGLNPLSIHLSDVSEVPGTCATYLQKKAMETSKVYAQINYSFVSNGKPVENDAKIYVPVDGSAKVFYLFNENKIGTVPCEVIDGYCIFNRYFDGSYVICSAS